jgi:molybdenum cofactor cytidylyltransferase
MGATIAEAVTALPSAKVIAIALGDMPLLQASTLARLASLATEDLILVPTYQGRRGHPVFFGARFAGDLKSLTGDRGAAMVLKRYGGACREVPVDDPGIHLDADTPDALEALRPRA